ncbi:unnamed protein product [Trifolium pratense]|uniref:Uncharacterized protein n=1 Tax=Trifolium pratense TaxID=57577 RepID=A0ACB0IBZ8_TRIPR|nr:unnamed protein product [Trifolium pratense]
MCEIVKFVVMIVFLSVFFLSADMDYSKKNFKCRRDIDCRNNYCSIGREPSIATCAYIVVQILKLTPSQESSDHMYYIMLRNGTELKTKYSFVLTLRIFFSILGAVMIGTLVYTLVTDGSPFRKELSTLWMLATLAGFYINVLALIVWVSYKESSCICTVFWIVLFVCFGSVATCAYVVWQLFQISCSDPAYFILVKHNHSGHGLF